jgi:hypothetical protein
MSDAIPAYIKHEKRYRAEIAEAFKDGGDLKDQIHAFFRKFWVPAEKYFPDTPRCVLATDLEAHFVAVYEDEQWSNAHTSEQIDSVITHWMELPEVPE